MVEKIILRGSPEEIGRQHGKLGKNEVLKSLETYERLFYGYQQYSWKEAREEALKHVKAIWNHDPDLIEEMQGVAKGAGIDFEDVLALNARSEIALGNYKAGRHPPVDGCTAIATFPPAGYDTIIGQNWDWKGCQKDSLLLLEIHHPGKPVITMVTEGGIIGKIGYNSAGLGVCFNALITNRKTDQLPVHLALREILNSLTLPEAIANIKDGKIAATASFIIGKADQDGKGMAVNVEASPFGLDFLEDGNGILVHTNHIISDSVKKGVEDRNEFKWEDSMLRMKRAQQLINVQLRSGGKIDEGTYMAWLSDTLNAPNAINHFENQSAPEHRRMETVFSIIMNLSQRKAFLCIGKPSENRYTEMGAIVRQQ